MLGGSFKGVPLNPIPAYQEFLYEEGKRVINPSGKTPPQVRGPSAQSELPEYNDPGAYTPTTYAAGVYKSGPAYQGEGYNPTDAYDPIGYLSQRGALLDAVDSTERDAAYVEGIFGNSTQNLADYYNRVTPERAGSAVRKQAAAKFNKALERGRAAVAKRGLSGSGVAMNALLDAEVNAALETEMAGLNAEAQQSQNMLGFAQLGFQTRQQTQQRMLEARVQAAQFDQGEGRFQHESAVTQNLQRHQRIQSENQFGAMLRQSDNQFGAMLGQADRQFGFSQERADARYGHESLVNQNLYRHQDLRGNADMRYQSELANNQFNTTTSNNYNLGVATLYQQDAHFRAQNLREWFQLGVDTGSTVGMLA